MSNFLATYTTKIKNYCDAKFCNETRVQEMINNTFFPLALEFQIQVTSGQNFTLWGDSSNGMFFGKINWGDGVTTDFYTAIPNHIYNTAGTYNVKIYGIFPNLRGDSGDNSKQALRSVIAAPGITDFYQCFSGCTGLTSLPAGLFDNCTSATDFYQCFSGCTGLTSLPAGLFDNCTSATGFSYCFSGCTGLTSLPAGLFDNCTLATNFSSCFSGCTGLTLRGDEFTLATLTGRTINFQQCFKVLSTSDQVAGTAPALWDAGLLSSSSQTADCFMNRTLLTNYSSIPSAWL